MSDLHFYEQRSSGVVVVLHEILTFFYYEHSEAVRETVLDHGTGNLKGR